MRWDDLRVFLEVARQGQLLAAGRALGLDAATVGRRITALETALGAKLFDRSPRGYTLTEAGQRLTGPAGNMESIMASATMAVGGAAETLSGTVRIGAPEGVATYILSRACVHLSDAHPDLSVELVALPRVFSLSRREADLAIAVSPPSAGRLVTQRVADYTLHLYAVPEIAERVRSLTDLKKERLIGYISDMIFDKELDYLPLLGPDFRPALASTSVMVQQRWVEEGAGLAILHDFAAAESSRIVRVLEDEIAFTRSFHLIRHEDDQRVARIRRAAAALTDALRKALTRR
ncbi:MAG: LysR family transcriptional regulator [Rubricella sp.]